MKTGFFSSTKINVGFVSLIALITVAEYARLGRTVKTGLPPHSAPPPTPTPEVGDTRDLSKYGAVNYSSDVAPTSARFLANRRYDKQHWVGSPPIPPEVGGIGRIKEGQPPPSLPIAESSVIVVGKIVGTIAYLSNDKQGVYTEFTIRVSERLKTDGKSLSKTVLADREGGVVTYPVSAHVLYQDSQFHLPLLGNTYLMFLTRDDSPNFRILTAYELKDGQVTPIEYRPEYDEIQKKGDKDFLQIIRDKIRQSN